MPVDPASQADDKIKTDALERAADPVADNPNPDITADPASPSPAPEGEAREPAGPAPSARDQRLKDIAERRRAKLEAENAPDTTLDFSDPTQTYGNMGRPPAPEPEPEPPAAADPAAPPAAPDPAAPPAPEAPRKFKLKVRQQDVELDEDQVLAAARIGLAGQSYLDEAREVLKAARTTASRPPQDGNVHDDELDPSPTPAGDPPQDALELAIQEIQLGDPKEAAAKLRAVIKNEASTSTQHASFKQKIDNDWNDTQSAFAKFQGDHADIVSDKFAAAAIREGIVDGYREDLIAAGVPADSLPADADKLADTHRIARVNGLKVRNTEQLLTAAKEKYQTWRGVSPTPKPNPSPPPREQPRVVIDRTERRQGIPTQPTRSTAPPQVVPNAAPQPRSRSVTIQQMKQARGK